jgi:hypothetical protein
MNGMTNEWSLRWHQVLLLVAVFAFPIAIALWLPSAVTFNSDKRPADTPKSIDRHQTQDQVPVGEQQTSPN